MEQMKINKKEIKNIEDSRKQYESHQGEYYDKDEYGDQKMNHILLGIVFGEICAAILVFWYCSMKRKG